MTTNTSTAPPSLGTQLIAFANTIKLSHTLFSLPFALTAALYAWPQRKIDAGPLTVVFIILAVLFARTFAMGVNRLADRKFDATNQRTKNRELVTGTLSLPIALALTLGSLAGFIAVSFAIGGPCGWLAPPVALCLGAYSFFKRFSWVCHLFLGLCLALAPAGAWVALTQSLDHLPWFLMTGVLFWVAGFDLVYAIQDMPHDLAEGLHSFPSRFGETTTLGLSRTLHVLSLLSLIGFGVTMKAGPLAWIGLLLFSGVLVWTHLKFKGDTLKELPPSFMNLNALASVGYFLFSAAAAILLP